MTSNARICCARREQFQCRRIDPLDILVNHQHWLLLKMPKLRKKDVERLLLALLRVHQQSTLPVSWY